MNLNGVPVIMDGDSYLDLSLAAGELADVVIVSRGASGAILKGVACGAGRPRYPVGGRGHTLPRRITRV